MKAPFSQNELQLLDRQMTELKCELADVVSLFESRLGETNDFAVRARTIEEDFAALASRVHMQYEVSAENEEPKKKEESLCRRRNQPAEVTN